MNYSSKKLKERYWKYDETINPNYIRYQRIQGSVGGSNMSFNNRDILPNSLLSAKAYIKWNVSIDRQRNAVPIVVTDFNPADVIFAKANVFENCLNNIRVSINGYNIGDYNEPRYWAKYLTRSFKSDNLAFSTDGGTELKYNGTYNQAGLPFERDAVLLGVGGSDDKCLRNSIDVIFDEFSNAVTAPSPTINLEFMSLINFGLFNKYIDSNTLKQ